MEYSSQKKGPLVLNWNILMPNSKDDDPPPELVISGDRSQPTSGYFGVMSDLCIEEEINRQRGNLEKLRNLPDNGEKLRARLKMLEDERERRKLQRVDGDGSEKPTQSERENIPRASEDLKEATSSSFQGSQSEFFAHFSKKLGEKKDTTPQNASGKECSYLGAGRRNTRFNGHASTRGRQKSTLPLWSAPFQCPTKCKLSNGDQSGHCSRNCMENLPNFKKRQKLPLSFASNGSRQSNTKTYFLEDEDSEPDPIEQKEQGEEVDDCTRDSKVYYPARDDPDSVEISYSDMQCLAPQAFLSSTVMNFYIRYLQKLTLATERRSINYHFFNTYFYSKLQKAVSKKGERESSFPKLRRWWKGVNIFHKAYIFLPVNKDFHWSLVIVCIPDKEDDSGPIMLHLDSLGLHSSRPIFNNVKNFLVEEWKHFNAGEAHPKLPISNKIWKNFSRRIDEKRVEVPQQKNEYDCGLFVLYFIERFIGEVRHRLKRKDLSMFGKMWFKAEEASDLRQKIKKLLEGEFGKAREGKSDSPKLTTVSDEEEKFEQPTDV